MFVAPIFGQEGVPNLSKIGISGTLAIMVLYTVEPVEAAYSSVIGYGILVLKEASVGLLIGFAAYVCNAIILFAGNVIDMDMGISMAQEFDPTLRTQVSVTGSMYNYFMLIFLFVTGMYQYLIRAVADSFVLIPLGGANYHTDMLLTV
nr:flagellar biosynthetic protein FliR [Lachnospiraceae bacterium]